MGPVSNGVPFKPYIYPGSKFMARMAAGLETGVTVAVTLPPLAEERAPAPELAPEWRERMASVLEPARCGRCGYVVAKCDCAVRYSRRYRHRDERSQQ